METLTDKELDEYFEKQEIEDAKAREGGLRYSLFCYALSKKQINKIVKKVKQLSDERTTYHPNWED